MTTTGTIPTKLLGGLKFQAGDTLQVLDVTDSDIVVAIRRSQPRPTRPTGKAGAWLRGAKGSVQLAAGVSVEDARLAHLRRKHGLES